MRDRRGAAVTGINNGRDDLDQGLDAAVGGDSLEVGELSMIQRLGPTDSCSICCSARRALQWI